VVEHFEALCSEPCVQTPVFWALDLGTATQIYYDKTTTAKQDHCPMCLCG
jgi:hypothetical protein